MRWFKNLKWLFNHPPTNITTSVPDGTVCEFCGKDTPITNYSDVKFCICYYCLAKALRLVLSDQPKKEKP